MYGYTASHRQTAETHRVCSLRTVLRSGFPVKILLKQQLTANYQKHFVKLATQLTQNNNVVQLRSDKNSNSVLL